MHPQEFIAPQLPFRSFANICTAALLKCLHRRASVLLCPASLSLHQWYLFIFACCQQLARVNCLQRVIPTQSAAPPPWRKEGQINKKNSREERHFCHNPHLHQSTHTLSLTHCCKLPPSATSGHCALCTDIVSVPCCTLLKSPRPTAFHTLVLCLIPKNASGCCR